MPKLNKADLQPDLTKDMTKKDLFADKDKLWLIQDWISLNGKLLVSGTQGSSKTWVTLWMAFCIAAGQECFGHLVNQGPVLIVDEETPIDVIENRLDSFANHFNIDGYKKLDITVMSLTGVKWGEKNIYLNDMIETLKPVYISLESLVAMIPPKGGLSENSPALASMVNSSLINMMKYKATPSLTCHCAKRFTDRELSIEEINEPDITMQTTCSGSGNVVGLTCDTGIYIHKISDDPLRLAIITKPRRKPVDAKEIKYIELKENEYGGNEAWMELIPPPPTLPIGSSKKIFALLSDGTNKCNNVWKSLEENKISSKLTLDTKININRGIKDLERHSIISKGDVAISWKMNPNYMTDCEANYLKELII